MWYLILILAGLIVAQPLCLGTPSDTVTSYLLEHEVRFDKATRNVEKRFVVVFDFRDSDLNKELIREVVRLKLRRTGYNIDYFDGKTFQKSFELENLSREDVLSPKLVIEVDADHKQGGTCSLTYIEYSASGKRMMPRSSLAKKQEFPSGSKSELEENVTQYLQKELETFVQKQMATVSTKRSRIAFGRAARGRGDKSTLSYSLSWNDPAAQKAALEVGASVGTPAMGNLHFGLVNIGRTPIMASVSGMYFAPETKGLQGEVAWAFARGGRFKHAVGLVVSGINQKDQYTRERVNEYGTVIATEIETVNELKWYVGPAYVLYWRDIRFECGAGYAVSPNTNSKFRALFQIGYTPRFQF